MLTHTNIGTITYRYTRSFAAGIRRYLGINRAESTDHNPYARVLVDLPVHVVGILALVPTVVRERQIAAVSTSRRRARGRTRYTSPSRTDPSRRRIRRRTEDRGRRGHVGYGASGLPTRQTQAHLYHRSRRDRPRLRRCTGRAGHCGLRARGRVLQDRREGQAVRGAVRVPVVRM